MRATKRVLIGRFAAAGGFDLTRGDALGRHRLQAELTERQRRTRSRNAVDTALMRLPELRFLWLHHGLRPQTFSISLKQRRDAAAKCRPRPSSCPGPSDRAQGFRP